MSLQSYYDNVCLNPSTWADPDAALCSCLGHGWWLSDLDTWHKCPYHDGPHPEFEEPEPFIGPIQERATTTTPTVEEQDYDIPF